MKTALKFLGAAAVGWVGACVVFCVTLVMLINRRMPKYNGYMKGAGV